MTTSIEEESAISPVLRRKASSVLLDWNYHADGRGMEHMPLFAAAFFDSVF